MKEYFYLIAYLPAGRQSRASRSSLVRQRNRRPICSLQRNLDRACRYHLAPDGYGQPRPGGVSEGPCLRALPASCAGPVPT
jgi:hypothetical protein